MPSSTRRSRSRRIVISLTSSSVPADDPDAAFGVESSTHELEPFQGIHVHAILLGCDECRTGVVDVREHPEGERLCERVAERGGLHRSLG